MRSRCALPPSALVTVVAVAIAIIGRVAGAGFAVIGLRSRGRVGAAVAVDATVTALDTSSLRSVADKAHSSAVVAPIRRSRRHRFPTENAAENVAPTGRGRRFPHTGRSPLQAPPAPTLEYSGVRSSTPENDNGGQQERGTSVFSGAMRGFSYPCRPQGISRGLLSITGTRSPIARLPRAWRCNTLETRIVCTGIRRIAPPRRPSGRGLHRRPRARRYRRPGGGGEPRRLRQVR